MGYKKRYAKLYNKLWEEVHRGHRVVFATSLTHDELVDEVTERVAVTLAETPAQSLRAVVDLIFCDLMFIASSNGYEGD